LFTSDFTLLVTNEVTGYSGNMMGNKANAYVEISLLTSDSSIIYRNKEINNIALAVTANAKFFAVYMKSGEIKIYDTKIGSLIVPYYQKANLVFLTSYPNGNLAFIDLQGKITVINIIQKAAVYENADTVKTLLTQLDNKETMSSQKDEENKVEEETENRLRHFISSFYMHDQILFVEIGHKERNFKKTYCLNTQLGAWEVVSPISKTIIEDINGGNIGSVQKLDDMNVDTVAEQPGIGLSIEQRDQDLFKLDKDKKELIDDLGLAISRMDKQNQPLNYDDNTFEKLEEKIMLYERLEHKEEYFSNLETYLIKCVQNNDVDRIDKIVSKYDSQFGVSKKLKLDSSGYDEYFLGIKKSKILEEFIKPKIKLLK
jgi:hypothetical protein